MIATVHELLTRLLELTPLPPADREIDALLTESEDIIHRRAELFDALVPPLELSDADRPLVLELQARDAAWQDALTAALRTVRRHRHGTEQLRAYAPTV
jgi:hypothetical protein